MLRVLRKKYINRIFMGLTFFVLTALMIMYVIRVNETITLQGKIVTDRVEFIKSPCNTYVKDIFVVDREEVKKGQVIGTLDEGSILIYVQDIQSKILDTKKRKVAIEKERFDYTQKIMQINVQKEDFLYKKNNDIKETKLQIGNLENEISKSSSIYEYNMKTMEENINNCKEKLKNAENNYKKYQTLYNAGASSSTDLKRYELEIADLKAQLIELESRKKSYEADNSAQRIAILKQNLQSLYEHLNGLMNNNLTYDREVELRNKELERNELDINDYEKHYSEEISIIDQELETYNNQLKKIKELLDTSGGTDKKVNIISPCDGIISFRNTSTNQGSSNSNPGKKSDLVGRRFAQDEVILEIASHNDAYIESYISEKDFPFIFEKDRVVIVLSAFPYEKYGTLEGVIDRLYKEPIVSNTGTSYKCKIRITNVNNEVKPYIGLTTLNTVIIKRDINLIQYLLDTTFDESR